MICIDEEMSLMKKKRSMRKCPSTDLSVFVLMSILGNNNIKPNISENTIINYYE